MTKEELRSLTIEQLNGMTEEQLDVVANQTIELLEEDEVEQHPEEDRNKRKVSREGGLGCWKTFSALISSDLVMSLMQLIMGK